MKPGAIKTNKMNRPWPRRHILRPAIEPVESTEADDLSRFEGEGGLQALVPPSHLIDVPLENAIWRRERRRGNQTPGGSLTKGKMKSRCPHCNVKLGNYLYADACPHCHEELKHNTAPLLTLPEKDPLQPKPWLARSFLRIVRFVES